MHSIALSCNFPILQHAPSRSLLTGERSRKSPSFVPLLSSHPPFRKLSRDAHKSKDDGVKYPASSPTPVRENRDSASELLSLGSLWLLAALRDRYEQSATPKLCEVYCIII